MREIGGYIELDTYRLPMLHDGAIALNCGRSCLAYLIETRNIKKISLPYFMCDSVFNLCLKYDITMYFYHVDKNFQPLDITIDDDTWLYVMNYYGQLSSEYITALKAKYDRVIIDNAHAYFDEPVKKTDTIYTCRKYFGVADGAFLYTDCLSNQSFPLDESYDRMRFLLGRYERTASEFYRDNQDNNHRFTNEHIKRMSILTQNLLHGIDYEFVKKRRSDNYNLYHKSLKYINQIELREIKGAFAYPLLIKNGVEVRKALQQKKIYIPTLWPNVLSGMSEDSLEYRFAKNILPLPCDQRYGTDDISYVISRIKELLEEK